LEGYIELLLAAFINFGAPEGNAENILENHIVAACLLTVTFLIIPLTLIWILKKPFEELNQPNFLAKWGPLY
jgi:hypothetical protein